MICPFCSAPGSRVVRCRREYGGTWQRERWCPHCYRFWFTYETCPGGSCGDRGRVFDSELTSSGLLVWRRRLCEIHRRRWTTYEMPRAMFEEYVARPAQRVVLHMAVSAA